MIGFFVLAFKFTPQHAARRAMAAALRQLGVVIYIFPAFPSPTGVTYSNPQATIPP